ncbi:hypothetical protein A2291_01255 [candidate division WOR-1 bacterium RIFOXYB2_FULL_42_35]|uniref:Permease n=1 Tax=candidate division WOR-1 bacterium RIFOXYC2_FULL_41_25 TaxID=1802586 RepID=A0A1F4TL31_UNCSA|nr:MAG: hypothetical protein A2247_04680 [candidate division WOR-1 bacterium RIFOXYA2_FULL_41_14]OGC22934.1 MAG: hypothetical protein A2291_01255 [candidate division WOR-1 bacterium RIFOXYB2_FULL_42_35]OGC33415.1 MAG: hypothetical protein A2462_06645 [candidate division WOR-1 bacterium RIFOXYC2_FULL_41_25]OGC43471.1 MAG: hypothetical protein A2548_06805 [candidate division WOR-1 bacterium RIFOXYD2_FULL_41_8]
MNINLFISSFIHYIIEVAPALLLGFLISGLIHEFLPDNFVNKYLGTKNFLSILWATLIGAMLPICCIGSLPVALSFHKRGARLGPILAFLVATPATSITALLVTYRLLGLNFTIFIFLAAVVMGITMGLIGNTLTVPVKEVVEEKKCPHCVEAGSEQHEEDHVHKYSFISKLKSALHYSFFEMPKEIGVEVLIGLALAAFVVSFAPLSGIISTYLAGSFGYVFALVFGVAMYICSTATVPLVHALTISGMSMGAGMVFLLAGPITSFSTLLVVKKEFGSKILLIYLTVICVIALVLGYSFSLLFSLL